MGLIKDSFIGYVNLDRRTDRREKMEEALRLHQIRAERFRGVLPEERTEQKAIMTKMLSRPQKGALGCFLAQMDVMREALMQGKHAWVMEDDLVFCSDFRKRIDYINDWCKGSHKMDSRKPPKSWDIIWLGGTFHVNPPWWHRDTLGRDAELTDDPRMIRTYGSFCTYAYIINRSSIQAVHELLLETLPTSIGIDYSMIQISPKLKTFAFVPGCIKQYSNESDQYPGAYTDFQRFEKLNGTIGNSAYWWQDKMEDFDPLTFNWAEAGI